MKRENCVDRVASRISRQSQQYRLTILISSAATLPSEEQLNNASSRRYEHREVQELVATKSTHCGFCTNRNIDLQQH